MNKHTEALTPSFPQPDGDRRWSHRRDVALALLAWFAVSAIVVLALSHIGHIVLLLIFASLLTYLLFPVVTLLERRMPRFAAMALIYLLVIGLVGIMGYLIVYSAGPQVQTLSERTHHLFAPGAGNAPSPLAELLHRVGVQDKQIADARQQVAAQAENLAGRLLPLFKGLVDSVLDTVLVLVLSAYLLLDGERAGTIIRANTPRSQRPHMELLLETLQRIVGGYVRGQLLLSALIGVLVGVGMLLFRVPCAALLGLLAFVLAFIPILGTFVSGAACVLLALTRGWLIAGLVLGYFVLMHVIEGDILGPRIVGKALGIHPVLSILAVIGGAELFGIKGALFGAPVVGFVQAVLTALWAEWKRSHPEEFPDEKNPAGGSPKRAKTPTARA